MDALPSPVAAPGNTQIGCNIISIGTKYPYCIRRSYKICHIRRGHIHSSQKSLEVQFVDPAAQELPYIPTATGIACYISLHVVVNDAVSHSQFRSAAGSFISLGGAQGRGRCLNRILNQIVVTRIGSDAG